MSKKSWGFFCTKSRQKTVRFWQRVWYVFQKTNKNMYLRRLIVCLSHSVHLLCLCFLFSGNVMEKLCIMWHTVLLVVKISLVMSSFLLIYKKKKKTIQFKMDTFEKGKKNIFSIYSSQKRIPLCFCSRTLDSNDWMTGCAWHQMLQKSNNQIDICR